MKKLLTILTIITFLGCAETDNSPNYENDRLELLPEPDKELREEYENTMENNDSIVVEDSLEQIIQKDSLVIKNPHQTMQRIFDNYNQYQESTDSPHNLDSLQQSLKILESTDIDEETLILIVNIWMYYTVTDFGTRECTFQTLLTHKEKSIIAINNRIENKMDWESDESAPYSELQILLQQLESEE